MKKISYWARTHKWTARIIIILLIILLNIIGFETGILLSLSGVIIPAMMVLLLFCLFLIGTAFYPSRQNKKPRSNPSIFYIKQKSCDFLLAFSIWGMAVCLGDNPNQLFVLDLSAKSTVENNFSLPKDSVINTYKSIKDFSISMKDEKGKTLRWKERKKLLKDQIHTIKKDNKLSPAEKTILTILSVLVALGLLFLIAALSCSLSCDGFGAAAVLLGVGGGALIIFLLTITIRAINNKKRKKNQTLQNPITTN